MLFKDISPLRCSCDSPGAPGNARGCVGQDGIYLGVHGSTGYFGVPLVSAPGFFQHHISPRFQYAEHSPAITHSEFLHVVLNKLLIIFPLIIHLTEEQVE